MKSVMQHQFSQVPKADIPRSTFDRTHGYKTAFDAGLLIPFFLDEVLPGDTFNVKATIFARLATPIFPVMDNMYMDTQFFAVPIRLVWDNWARFNGEQRDPGDSVDFLVPQISSPAVTGYTANSIHDYMGLPVGIADMEHSALWHRAYNLIYNEWYRDQNMVDSLVNHTGDGPDPDTDYVLQRRGKRHDYFTSALPWPQKGESVSIPLGTRANISGLGMGPAIAFTTGAVQKDATTDAAGVIYPQQISSGSSGFVMRGTAAGAGGIPDVFADLTNAASATINQLRQSFQIQKMLERDARGGTRLTEIVRSHFGVSSPDSRMQRPEYLGGGSMQVNVTPVPQTSGTAGVGAYSPTPQGNMSGYGVVTGNNHGFTKSFTEHCVLIGLVSVRADLTYQAGLNRMWSRQTRYDFYWPSLSHIGEQEILNKEIFCQGTVADDNVFGYQERHAEYRYKPSQITGLFRSTHPQSLDAWHLSQEFGALPTLNKTFIEENPPLDRIIAVTNEPHFLFDSYIQMHCARPMPVYGVPGLIDHF